MGSSKMATSDSTSLIKLLNKQVLSQFLHECIDDLIGKKRVSFDNGIGNDIEWQKENYETARKFVQNLYQNAIILPDVPLESSLTEFSEEYRKLFVDCFDIRKPEIVNCLIKSNMCNSETPVVTDFDWKMKWIMGSSSLASIREPVLQVDLHCRKEKSEKCTINFEMNAKELDEFIAALEEVKHNQPTSS